MLGFASFLSLDIQEEMLNVTVKVRFFILLLLFLNHYSHELMNFVELWTTIICWKHLQQFLPFYSLNGSQNVMSCCVYVYMVLLFDA